MALEGKTHLYKTPQPNRTVIDGADQRKMKVERLVYDRQRITAAKAVVERQQKHSTAAI